jgi:hypothetical protein
METALSQLKRTGALVLVGAGIKPPRLDPNRILLNELVVTGAFCYDGDGFEAALALLASPEFPRDELVEPDDISLDGLLGAIERLHNGEIPAKVLVAPSRRWSEGLGGRPGGRSEVDQSSRRRSEGLGGRPGGRSEVDQASRKGLQS